MIMQKLGEYNEDLLNENSTYNEFLIDQKFNLQHALELGCYPNLIKNYKTFEYIKVGNKAYGVGISSIYVPIDTFI